MAPNLQGMPCEIRNKIFIYAIDVDNAETEYSWQPSKPGLKTYRSLTLVDRNTRVDVQQLYTASSFSRGHETAPKLFFDNVPDLYDAYQTSTTSTILRDATFTLSRTILLDYQEGRRTMVTQDVELFITGLKGFKKKWLRDPYPGFYDIPEEPWSGLHDPLSQQGFEFLNIPPKRYPDSPREDYVLAVRFPTVGKDLKLTNYWWWADDGMSLDSDTWASFVLEGNLKDLKGAFERFKMDRARTRLQGEREAQDNV